MRVPNLMSSSQPFKVKSKVTVKRLCIWLNRIASEGPSYYIEHTVSLLAKGVETESDDAELLGTSDSAEATVSSVSPCACALLIRPLCCNGTAWSQKKQQNRVGVFAEVPNQVARNRLLGAVALPDGKCERGMRCFAAADDGIMQLLPIAVVTIFANAAEMSF